MMARVAGLLALVSGAAAHTNLVGFDANPVEGGVSISAFFGTYHSSAPASGAISLYRCSTTTPSSASQCTTEAYGHTAENDIETTTTTSLSNAGSITWSKTTQGSWSLSDLTSSGFVSGSTLFHDLPSSSVANIQMGTIDVVVPCDGTTYLLDYDNDPETTVAKDDLSVDWAPCSGQGSCGSFTMSDLFMTVGDNCGVALTGAGGGEATASGDPHLLLPHSGRTDFRGEDKAFYNFLSAKGLSLNVMTEMADFELHPADSPRHKHVHGSFLTQAHVVARTNSSKIVRVSVWAAKIGDKNVIWANGTIDSEPAFKVGPKQERKIDDISLSSDYSTLRVLTPEFSIDITPRKFRLERNVVGIQTRLDIKLKLLVEEANMAVAPHGIIGQAWDGDGKAIDGEQDAFPDAGDFTTYAMAGGAIEGTPADYKMASMYATGFKFSRFDLEKAEPRDVAKLVAAGVLRQPKVVADAANETVGATEYETAH